MDKCRKCWRILVDDGKKTKRLWCKHCEYYVNQELRWERCRAFRFYFEYRLKCKRQ